MTNEESKLLSDIAEWRRRCPDNAINDVICVLRDLPKAASGHEPEAQVIVDKLIALKAEAKGVPEAIIDRKLRELRILGMK